MLGFATRAASVPLVVRMRVAAFGIHSDDPWNKKEFALLYAIPFLTLALTGPGSFAVDAYLVPRLRRR
jgi:putative oxidoreductase